MNSYYIYNRKFLKKRLNYKFFYISYLELYFLKNINFKIDVKDDYEVYNIYYFLQNIFNKKPIISGLKYKIFEGGLRQSFKNISIKINNSRYVYNFIKIIYIFINKKKIININKYDLLLLFLINDLKNLNLRENLNNIKTEFKINIEKEKKIKKFFIIDYFKLIGLFK